MSTNLEELESLLFDWESRSLDDRGLERLREILRRDADARSRFVQMQMVSAAMRLDSDAGLGLPPHHDAVLVAGAPSESGLVRRPLSMHRWFVLAASVLFCLLAGGLFYSYITRDTDRPGQLAATAGPNVRDASKEATALGVALLTRVVDATWHDEQSAIEAGQALAPGRFAIRTGHAQIEFFCGATVVIEGPAELELESATRARVRHGRLRAHVPPAARGFSLDIDGLQVVDLGTEFGLAVAPDGASVHVFDGEVELQNALQEKRLLKAGHAVARTSDGRYREQPSTPQDFVDIAGLETLAAAQRSDRYERWKAWSAQVRRDPRLIAYYAFDKGSDWGRRLECSVEPANTELDGAIVGAREVDGRWGAKRALEFKQPADRVRVQIPGEFGSLTLACWVKIDSLDRWYNSLFLTDGYDKGEPHWQIMDSGEIYFSVRPAERGEPGPRDFKALSPSFWNPSLHGKWTHLAVTCDVDTRTIIHYVNGIELSRHEVPETQMPSHTRIGTASIGNWALPTMPEARFAIRNLNGSIDEFAIFAAALTAKEISEVYGKGKP